MHWLILALILSVISLKTLDGFVNDSIADQVLEQVMEEDQSDESTSPLLVLIAPVNTTNSLFLPECKTPNNWFNTANLIPNLFAGTEDPPPEKPII